jgi:hypothetical protein
MAWYFHVVEQDDHSWMCRHGAYVYDFHPRLAEALAHITDLADADEPAQVFIHQLDSSVEELRRQPSGDDRCS